MIYFSQMAALLKIIMQTLLENEIDTFPALSLKWLDSFKENYHWMTLIQLNTIVNLLN